MLQWILAGIWPLLWHYGLAGFIIICALAWAWFMPVFRKTALWVALSVAITMIAYTVGIQNEHARMQKQIDAALAVEVEQGEQARTDAERDISHDTPERLRDDPRNRDNWKK